MKIKSIQGWCTSSLHLFKVRGKWGKMMIVYLKKKYTEFYQNHVTSNIGTVEHQNFWLWLKATTSIKVAIFPSISEKSATDLLEIETKKVGKHELWWCWPPSLWSSKCLDLAELIEGQPSLSPTTDIQTRLAFHKIKSFFSLEKSVHLTLFLLLWFSAQPFTQFHHTAYSLSLLQQNCY